MVWECVSTPRKTRKTYCEEINVEDHKVKTKAQSHGAEQKWVNPWGHGDQGLIFGQAVDSVAHLDGNKDGQGHGHWFGSLENVATETFEFFGFGWA